MVYGGTTPAHLPFTHDGSMRGHGTVVGAGQLEHSASVELLRFGTKFDAVVIGKGTLQTNAQAVLSTRSVQSELFLQPTEAYLSSISCRRVV